MADFSPPANVKGFEERLLEVSESLPKRLRQCADYVASNKDRIAVSTVAEMAGGAGVQPSAFIRFCQILGFSGFSEMQRLFRETYVGGWPDYSTRLQHLREKPEGSPSALLGEFVEAGRASIESLLSTVDPTALNEGANLLLAAKMVHIIGLGRSFSVATYVAYLFEKMEVPAVLHTSLGKLDNRHAIREGDALLAFTFAPYSAPTLELVEDVAARKIPIVAVTDSAIGPLAKFRPTTLLVSEVDFGAFRSPAATLCLATALAVSVGTAKSQLA